MAEQDIQALCTIAQALRNLEPSVRECVADLSKQVGPPISKKEA